MATIITVHGTFAHLDVAGGSIDGTTSPAYWWRADSPFNEELASFIQSDGEPVDVSPFLWSGDNSEQARRSAGRALYRELMRLEKAAKPYCIVAHSHGGSVVSEALLEAAARRQELPNLKRWITVGTPFVELRRERFLFMRLPILLKAMYVASFMLLVIFACAWAGRIIAGQADFSNTRELYRFGIGALLAATPGLIFLLIAWIRERRARFFYRPRVKKRARALFSDRWLPLTHEDDEAVRALGSLRTVSLPIFDRQFAVPALSVLAVFMLPALYVGAITSPHAMVSLADFLRTTVYDLDQLEARTERFEASRRRLFEATRSLRTQLKTAKQTAADAAAGSARQVQAEKTMDVTREALRRQWSDLEAEYPDMPELRRASRFKRRFLERGGEPCNARGQLCDDGENIALNANLLLHVVTDEVTSLVLDEESRRSLVGRLAGYVLIITLVPFVMMAIAVVWVLIVQLLARWFSRFASGWLDAMTWAQIRRAAIGNDTEDEVAVGTAPYPKWAGNGRPFLPPAISSEITAASNDATFQSLGKFRDALSDFVLGDGSVNAGTSPGAGDVNNLLAYLTWNELIHTSYFAVPNFMRLVAAAVTRTEGFEATARFKQDAHYVDTDDWLIELERRPAQEA